MAQFSDEERIAASARMTSEPIPVARGQSAAQNLDVRWRTVRGKVARAIVTDPDIVLYFRMLLANRVLSRLNTFRTTFDLYARYLSLLALPAPVGDAPSTEALSQSTAAALGSLGGGLDRPKVDRALADAAALLRNQAARTTFRGMAVPRGEEARRLYAEQAARLGKEWAEIAELLSIVRSLNLGTPAIVQAVALETPISNLQKTADLGVPADQETSYTSQMLAGFSAVSRLARPFEFGVKFRSILDGETFPPDVSVDYVAEGGQITGLKMYLSIRGGPPTQIEPNLLHIFGGSDLVQVDRLPPVLVSSTTNKIVSFNGPSATPAEMREFAGEIRIISAAWYSIAQFVREVVDAFFIDSPLHTENPRVGNLAYYNDLAKVAQQTPTNPAEVVEMIANVGQLGRFLYGNALLSQETFAIVRLANLGNSVGTRLLDADRPVATRLVAALSGVPTFLLKSIPAGRSVLSMLRSEGFDRAADLLIYGELDEVMQMSSSDASYSGRTEAAARGLAAVKI